MFKNYFFIWKIKIKFLAWETWWVEISKKCWRIDFFLNSNFSFYQNYWLHFFHPTVNTHVLTSGNMLRIIFLGFHFPHRKFDSLEMPKTALRFFAYPMFNVISLQKYILDLFHEGDNDGFFTCGRSFNKSILVCTAPVLRLHGISPMAMAFPLIPPLGLYGQHLVTGEKS